MDEEKLIKVSFQIPPSALESLSRLTEQLRMLTETISAQAVSAGKAAETEHVENGSFDAARFQALLQSTAEPRTVGTTASDVADARTVSAAVRKDVKDAVGAGAEVNGDAGSPSTANSNGSPQDIPPAQEDASPVPENDHKMQVDSIPTVQASAEEIVPNAAEARRAAEQQLPDPENARAEAEKRELLPSAAQETLSGGIEMPLGAGAVVQSQPDMPESRWSSVTEELVIPGPAPLTAEAVSLAFERDGRRYDNGFPLY